MIRGLTLQEMNLKKKYLEKTVAQLRELLEQVESLENQIIPLFYERDPKEISHEWIARVKDSMKTNIPQFSTRRMVKEYVERLYVKALK